MLTENLIKNKTIQGGFGNFTVISMTDKGDLFVANKGKQSFKIYETAEMKQFSKPALSIVPGSSNSRSNPQNL